MKLKLLLVLLISFFTIGDKTKAQSSLLENVKKNPNEARSICQEFRLLNSKGKSATSKDSINAISSRKNLSAVDAEILSIYVMGLHCPEVY